MKKDPPVKKADVQASPSNSQFQKKQKNLYLSAHARELLKGISISLGISETAVIELLVRREAALQNLGTSVKTELPDGP